MLEKKEFLINPKTLAEMTGISYYTALCWVKNYKFSPYVIGKKQTQIIFCEKFIWLWRKYLVEKSKGKVNYLEIFDTHFRDLIRVLIINPDILGQLKGFENDNN